MAESLLVVNPFALTPEGSRQENLFKFLVMLLKARGTWKVFVFFFFFFSPFILGGRGGCCQWNLRKGTGNF